MKALIRGIMIFNLRKNGAILSRILVIVYSTPSKGLISKVKRLKG